MNGFVGSTRTTPPDSPRICSHWGESSNFSVPVPVAPPYATLGLAGSSAIPLKLVICRLPFRLLQATADGGPGFRRSSQVTPSSTLRIILKSVPNGVLPGAPEPTIEAKMMLGDVGDSASEIRPSANPDGRPPPTRVQVFPPSTVLYTPLEPPPRGVP